MRRIIAIFVILSFIITAPAYSGVIGTSKGRTPRVKKIIPRNDSEVVIGPEGVDFKWGITPIPSGGRRAFRFRLYKEFGYGSIEKQELNPSITVLNVPASVFESGELYSWEVSQRGRHGWSDADRWSFKAKKETQEEDEEEDEEEDYK